MIELYNVSKIYKINKKNVTALDNINLKIADGEFAAIIGSSGSGKSTLLNILGCLDKPSGGKYLSDGKNVGDFSERMLTKFRGKKIGFVFQSFNLINELTAAENVALPLLYRGESRKSAKLKAEKVLNDVGMYERREHLPSQLSGGQMQRVAIARAIVGVPSLLLADEPTGNLDAQNSRETVKILKKLNGDGMTVILVTHDNAVAKKADRIIKICGGKI